MLFVSLKHFPCHLIGLCNENTLKGTLFSADLGHVATLLIIQA